MDALADPAAVSADSVSAALEVDPRAGLSADEAARRLAHDGPNLIPGPTRPAYLRIAARQIADPLVALLIGACAVSAAVGELTEAAVIIAIVVLDAVLGFAQEASAERAVLSLADLTPQVASVVRAGGLRAIPAGDVVRGDVLVVREGDRVPADARILDSQALEIDESALTGESLPVGKSAQAAASDSPLAERPSMVFSGTAVTRGEATGVVVATGPQTEMGLVGMLAASAEPPPTPLQRRLAGLSRTMVAIGLAIAVLLTAGMLAQGSSLRDAFLLGVAVAVAVVPEGLAATITIALAQGARAMARRGAIVRRLAAVETLGATTVIATDKTGTLTSNSLRVVGVAPVAGYDETGVLRLAAQASSVRTLDGGELAGDPFDVAIALAARERCGATDDGEPIAERPFDPERARQTVARRSTDGIEVATKGAPERLLALAAGEPSPGLRITLDGWAGKGLRVLAVGRTALPGDAALDGELDEGLELAGLIAVADGLRPGIVEAVTQARDAGVRTAMVTGDHPLTAAAIAAEAGLDRTEVHARATPADKLRIVEVLQADGDIVAVTGDGVNDAPALRKADVGVAMGSGTEVAREASDIVLADDNYATIVAAVAEGRRIGANLRKVVAFLLSANLGEVVLFAVAVLAGLGAPLTVIQVLTVNLVTDGLPALALGRDPLVAADLRRGPLPADRLFDPALRSALALAGVAIGAAATAAFLVGRADDQATGQTMAFASIVIAELAFAYSCRSATLPAWRSGRATLLSWSVGASLCALAAALTAGPVRDLLGTVALTPAQLLVVVAAGLAPAAAVEVVKAARRRT
jgi:Ca2+-transporting ATPase